MIGIRRAIIRLLRCPPMICLLVCTVLLSGLPVASVSGGSPSDRGGASDDPRASQQWYYGQRAAPFAHIPPGAWLRSLRQRAAVPAFSPRSAASGSGPFVSSSSTWMPIGPSPEHAGTVDHYGDVGGRITALAYDATNGILYAGLADGGVWKTTDNGSTWTELTDAQPSLAIGALAIDPNNPSIIYAGTGEDNFNIDAYYGAGILKSTDGGATWTLYGQSTFGGGHTTTFQAGVHIGKIVVDPHNSQHVLVASDQGVYLSTDGGQTYTATLQNTSLSGSPISDLIVDPSTNPSTVYAAWGYLGGIGDNGIYKSTDGGATFPAHGSPTGTGYPTGTSIGRIALAEAAPGAQLYMTASDPSNNASLGVWTSTDHGATWKQITASFSSAGPDLFGDDAGLGEEQGWYDIYIAVDPGAAGTLYVGGVNIFKSTNGGCTTANCMTFSDITNVYTTGSFTPHPDEHAIVFTNTASPSSFFVGNDGGVYRSTDGGTSFTDANGNLAGLQFYAASTTSNFTTNKIVYGGMQDNGTGKFTGTNDWTLVFGGDGGYTANDPSNPNTAYEEYANLGIHKTTDGGATWSKAITGINLGGETTLFIAPYIMDPSDATHLLAGTTHVYQTTDGAAGWTSISPALPAGTGFFGAISALAIAPSDHTNTFYAGTGDGKIWKTTNGSAATPTWTDITPAAALGVSGRYVTSLAVYSTNASDIVATYSGFATNAGGGTGTGTHVLRSTDGGATWIDVSTGLPDSPVTSVLRNPSSATTLYVGADDGFFFTTDAGAHWTQYQAGLPNVGIDQLFSDAGFTTLLAATHGRGVWTLPAAAFATAGLLVSPTTRTFNAVQGGANPPSQAVQLSAIVSPINWTATITYSSGTGWLAPVSSSGTATPGTPATITLNATTGSLAAGVYKAQVVFTNNANASDTATVNVAFVITGSGATNTPTNTPVGPTATPTRTNTPVPPTSTSTSTPVPPTATPTRTNTPVPPTSTLTRTNTPVPPTATPTRTNTPVGPTATPTSTNTPVPPTATSTRTNTPVPPTATPTRTNTPVPPTSTPTRTNTPVPPTATPTKTNTPIPPTATPTRTNTPAAPTSTRTNTPVRPTSTPTSTPTNCRFATAPFRNSAERNDLQAVFYATTSPNATVTTTYVTGSPASPPTAFLVIARPHSKATMTTLSGTLANGHYQYTFNDGPEGLAALIFLIPGNAALGTVTVNSSAVEACGSERSTTGFTVKTDEAESGFGDAEANSGSVTMAYTLPDGFAVPAGIATATSGAVSLVTTRKGGEAIHTLVFSVQLPQPK